MINARYSRSFSISSADQERDEWQDKSRPASIKVVDFDLPAKRLKPSASITAQSVTKAIQDSITTKIV